jgi:hypothetical protein
MKIKLEDMDGDDFQVMATASWAEASEDQTIAGSRWEHAGDDFAYAIINNVPGLVEGLEGEDYEIDDGEFTPVEDETNAA